MPTSWLYKLKEMAKPTRNRKPTKTSKPSEENKCHSPKLKTCPPISQNYAPKRASQYLPSKERLNLLHQLSSQQIKEKPISPVSTIERKSLSLSAHDIIYEKGPTMEELKLRPIQTKPRNKGKKIKVRSISPRCNPREKLMKRWMMESSLEVKYSTNPERDFMESIVEMVVEKIVELKDLEELLGCYLYLNSTEHHDAILKVFEKIRLVFIQPKYVI